MSNSDNNISNQSNNLGSKTKNNKGQKNFKNKKDIKVINFDNKGKKNLENNKSKINELEDKDLIVEEDDFNDLKELEEFDNKWKLDLYEKCKNHPEKNAYYQCPICKSYFCEKCIKVLKDNNQGQIKFICKSCYRDYKRIFYFFYLSLFFLLNLLVNSLGYNTFFEQLLNMFKYIRYLFTGEFYT